MDVMKSNNDMRIINLPKMIVASISFTGDNPEESCWQAMKKLIDEYLLDQKIGFRNIGFGYQDDAGNYRYELWVTIPADINLPEQFIRKEFPGGLYAALPANLANIGERWNELHELVLESDAYIHDTSPERFDYYFEECLDINTFHDENAKLLERQLDLLLAVKKVDNKNKTGPVDTTIKPIEVTLETKRLAGYYFKFDKEVKPWNKTILWYKLAQNIYKVGEGYRECIFEGNNTFSIVYGKSVYGKSINNYIFYMDKKNCVVKEVFGAIELIKSFPYYPEELHEYVLEKCKYLVFSIKIDPKDVSSKKISVKPLYDAAREYLQGKDDMVNPKYCLERDYRNDGRYVDKIELYIPLK